jgi:histidinol-phosphatase (PHP family)
LISNLHTHTCFSDGSGKPEKYVKEAIRQGFDILGFSDHSPVPFKNSFAIRNSDTAVKDYCNEIIRLREMYSGILPDLTLLLGLEIDYIPSITKPIDHYRKNFPFDYFIGSVHLVRNDDSGGLWFIDGPKASTYDSGLQNIFNNDIRRGVTAYFQQIREMVAIEKPDIVGHLDKIKMHNRGRFFSEEDPWYLGQVDETLEVIRDGGSVIEVNTRGLYKKRSDSLFPGPAILKKILSMKIPVMISSDAHRPHELSDYFPETVRMLQSIGFRSQWILHSGSWKEIAFTP